MALDEHKDGDSQLKLEDFTFLVEEGLAQEYNKWEIDYSDSWIKRGFTVTPAGYAGGSC